MIEREIERLIDPAILVKTIFKIRRMNKLVKLC